MIIQSSNVKMSSERSYSSQTTTNVSVSAANTNIGVKAGTNLLGAVADNSKNNNPFQQSMNQLMERFEEVRSNRASTIQDELESMRKIQMSALDYLMRWLFGDEAYEKMKEKLGDGSSGDEASMTTGEGNSLQWTLMERSESQFYSEEEVTSFSTTGTVVTQDGREIEFGISLEMSRSFQQYYETNYQYASLTMCDPLVINLHTDVANVSDQKFMFDLDSDGSIDEISMLNSNSGFLALDKNGDGKINNGKELFGTVSGNGFKDLAEYDLDQNGWIDEKDEVFQKLMIWSQDASGNNVLCGVAKAGVGAIYLGNVSTEFSLKASSDNTTNGMIQKTGVFLYEDGATGTVQHLDLVK